MLKSTIARKKQARAEKKSLEGSPEMQKTDKLLIEKRQREQTKRRNRRKTAKYLSSLISEDDPEVHEEIAIMPKTEPLHQEDTVFKTEGMQKLAVLINEKPTPQRNITYPSAGAALMQKKILSCNGIMERYKKRLLADVDMSKIPQTREEQLAYARSEFKASPHPEFAFPGTVTE